MGLGGKVQKLNSLGKFIVFYGNVYLSCPRPERNPPEKNNAQAHDTTLYNYFPKPFYFTTPPEKANAEIKIPEIIIP